jgi:transcriptional regulator GlxA family with amidase domain
VKLLKEKAGSDRAVSSVGFLLTPGFALMSYAATVEPLRAANQLSGKQLYRWWHATVDDQPAIASNGAAVMADFKFGAAVGALDLMLVCAAGNPAAFNHQPTLRWLRRLASQGTVIGGVSGGPYILAKAGLLHRRRCTVHWEHMPAMREAFPDIEFTGSLFEIARDRITCSGGAAALDMMVALIARGSVTGFSTHTCAKGRDRNAWICAFA